MSTLDLPSEAFSEQFPHGMGRPANAALVAAGITTLKQVSQLSEKESLGMHGVGPKAVRMLKEELSKQNLKLQHSI